MYQLNVRIENIKILTDYDILGHSWKSPWGALLPGPTWSARNAQLIIWQMLLLMVVKKLFSLMHNIILLCSTNKCRTLNWRDSLCSFMCQVEGDFIFPLHTSYTHITLNYTIHQLSGHVKHWTLVYLEKILSNSIMPHTLTETYTFTAILVPKKM